MREIDKVLPQTCSPAVDYSLLVMVIMMQMLEKVEIPPVVIPAEFPPPIFAATSLSFFVPFLYDALLPRTLRDHICSDF
jgi:hypothetical protein